MSPRLLPCPACERHVRVTESLCPFCGDALPLAYQSAGAANLPTKRLGRAAKFAFGAAVAGAMAVSGCGDDSAPADSGTVTDSGSATDSGTPGDASPDAADDSGMVALYGGPPADSGADAGDPADSGMLDSATGALYGGAPVDAG